jgi:tetratricopeptide (TPR) repeat protein
VVAARQVFQAAIASQNADFWDFQYALFALLGAERYDEAAFRFVHSFPSLMQATSFEPLEFLFLAMNAEQLHAKIADSTVCWLMLQFEVQLRVQDAGSPNRERLCTLIRRMHALSIKSENSAPPYGRAMLHLAIASVRVRDQKDSKVLTQKGRRRIFAPLDAALRAALALGVVRLLADLLHFYNDLYPLIIRPNVELLKDAILRLPRREPLPISPHALVGIYTTHAVHGRYSEAAMRLVEHHSELFRSAGFSDAYFACEMAAATILHDGRSSYRKARERLEPLMSHAADLHLSPQSIAYGFFSIADTYFAEQNYVRSAEHYQMVLHADFGASGLHQITCERLCDSLIFLKRHEEAVRVALADLRLLHADRTLEQKARLYARLAYAYAEHGSLKKAAISCLGLCRLATTSGSDALDVLVATVAGWVLAHFSYSHPAIPESSTNIIRDSKALSDDIPAEQLRKWRDLDPFRARRFIHVGTLFELLRDWQRSEVLYRRAIGIVLGSDRQHKTFRETAYVYLLRLARIHICTGKLEAAASEFKQAFEFSTDVYRRDHPESVIGGAGAYAILKASLDQPLRNCTDEKLMKFFDLLNSQFESAGSAQAWVCYRESEMLFDRLAVQSAKRRLVQAMDLAAVSAEYDLYWLTVQQKLFYRMQQTYARQDDWLRDALEVVVKLAKVNGLARFRAPFAESAAQAVELAIQGPFRIIGAVVKRFSTHWHEHAFLITAYALWLVAMRLRVLSSVRTELESFLRSEAGFLHPSDFD